MLIYYFLTSLKPLLLNQMPPISRESFLRRAHDCLEGSVLGDLELISQAQIIAKMPEQDRHEYWELLAVQAQSPFLKNWSKQAALIFEEIAHLLRGHESRQMPRVFIGALADPNPLVFESAVAHYLWQLLDEGISQDDFAHDQVLSYFIKLELCERFYSFNQEKGQAMLAALSQTVREVAHGS